ncbi:MAG: hypothetical protein Q8R76_08755 [Candidatus Omnitrophota bacterium]|nr:hypothetical protein [Candidatus Omnitrophota bacterium]
MKWVAAFCLCLGSFVAPVSAAEFELGDDYFFQEGEKFLVKGIVYVPVYPGEVPWELVRKTDLPEPLKARIRRDIDDIKGAGANTIRLWEVPVFVYEALKDAGDLAFIQTIWFDPSQKDLQNVSYKRRCQHAIRLTLSRIYSVYSEEEPPPILGFIVGSELSRASVESTDDLHPEISGYDGKYISAPKGSTATESFIAEIADYLKTYQTERYGHTHLVSYANEARTYDLLDTTFLDFRSFNAYSYAVLEYAQADEGSATGTLFQGWLEQLKRKHPNKLLLVTETGLSVAPGAEHYGSPDYGYGGNTPEEQATGLEQSWRDITTASSPIAGMVVHEYLDAWWKFGKEDSLEQSPDDVEEWFGLAAIEKEGTNFKTRLRPAYAKLQELWSALAP